jgi:uncharacterized protein YegJ (DUF2314 family)
MKLECSGKLPLGIFAEMERVGTNLSDIDTKDCETSLESLQEIAIKLYSNNPSKLTNTEDAQNIQTNYSDVSDNEERNYLKVTEFMVSHDKTAFKKDEIFAEKIGPVKMRRTLSPTPFMYSNLPSDQNSLQESLQKSLQELSIKLISNNPLAWTNTEDAQNIETNYSDVSDNEERNYLKVTKFRVSHDKTAFKKDEIFAEKVGPVKVRRNLSSTPVMSSNLPSDQKSVCENHELESNTQVGCRSLSSDTLNMKLTHALCSNDFVGTVCFENRNQKIEELEKELEKVSLSWDKEIRNIRQNMDVLRNEINSYKEDF